MMSIQSCLKRWGCPCFQQQGEEGLSEGFVTAATQASLMETKIREIKLLFEDQATSLEELIRVGLECIRLIVESEEQEEWERWEAELSTFIEEFEAMRGNTNTSSVKALFLVIILKMPIEGVDYQSEKELLSKKLIESKKVEVFSVITQIVSAFKCFQELNSRFLQETCLEVLMKIESRQDVDQLDLSEYLRPLLSALNEDRSFVPMKILYLFNQILKNKERFIFQDKNLLLEAIELIKSKDYLVQRQACECVARISINNPDMWNILALNQREEILMEVFESLENLLQRDPIVYLQLLVSVVLKGKESDSFLKGKRDHLKVKAFTLSTEQKFFAHQKEEIKKIMEQLEED